MVVDSRQGARTAKKNEIQKSIFSINKQMQTLRSLRPGARKGQAFI
jgi:hypothetical protein